MSKQICAAATLAILAFAPMSQARAQAPATGCNGRIAIDVVYQTTTANNAFEYFVFLRNSTNVAMIAEVQLSGFPANVTIPNPVLPGLQMGPTAVIANLRIGQGTNNMINISTVARVYDGASSSGPTVRVTNCRAA